MSFISHFFISSRQCWDDDMFYLCPFSDTRLIKKHVRVMDMKLENTISHCCSLLPPSLNRPWTWQLQGRILFELILADPFGLPFLYVSLSSMGPPPSCVKSGSVIIPLVPEDEMWLKFKSDLCSLFLGWATISSFKSLSWSNLEHWAKIAVA